MQYRKDFRIPGRIHVWYFTDIWLTFIMVTVGVYVNTIHRFYGDHNWIITEVLLNTWIIFNSIILRMIFDTCPSGQSISRRATPLHREVSNGHALTWAFEIFVFSKHIIYTNVKRCRTWSLLWWSAHTISTRTCIVSCILSWSWGRLFLIIKKLQTAKCMQ